MVDKIAIYNLLKLHPGGLTAKQIAKELGTYKQSINPILYNNVDLFERDNSYVPVWYLNGMLSNVEEIDLSVDWVLSKLNNWNNAKLFSFEDFQYLFGTSEIDVGISANPIVYETKNGRLIGAESTYEYMMLQYLEDNDLVTECRAQCITMPYITAAGRAANYTPDLVVLTKDKRIAVIEIKPVTAMDYHLNVEKYSALQKYCEERGYLYAMIDPSYEFMTFDELKNIAINTELYSFLSIFNASNVEIEGTVLNEEIVDNYYLVFGAGMTKKEFKLQLHSLVIRFGWFNKFKNGFCVYKEPVY